MAGDAAEPARRVLPSLLPMFPEPDAPAQEDPPPARRPRIPAPVRATRPRPKAAEETAPAPAPDRAPLPVEAAEPETVSAEEPSQSERPARKGRLPELRRGERWKRRLPRACW
ncbi:hypothetical protein [Methylobacterium nigriterrae]|uniref:hypothetical protein n=1 Tax=Methylobacterium nigriterrae TaxID=3127512 RepID=UPI0030141207